MTQPQLSTHLRLVLIKEMTDARADFSYGLATLRATTHPLESSAAVFALLAVGAEKLLKMSIGLAGLDDGSGWPDRSVMQQTYKHQILLMDKEVRSRMRSRLHVAPAPGWVTMCLDRLDNEPTLMPFLTALDDYARSGRFRNLDELAGSPQPGPAPADYWAEAERELFTTLNIYDPKVLVGLIADAMQRWWEAIQTGWTHQQFGSIGRELVTGLRLFDTVTNDGLRRLEPSADRFAP